MNAILIHPIVLLPNQVKWICGEVSVVTYKGQEH
jgi:hypothetical protein